MLAEVPELFREGPDAADGDPGSRRSWWATDRAAETATLAAAMRRARGAEPGAGGGDGLGIGAAVQLAQRVLGREGAELGLVSAEAADRYSCAASRPLTPMVGKR